MLFNKYGVKHFVRIVTETDAYPHVPQTGTGSQDSLLAGTDSSDLHNRQIRRWETRGFWGTDIKSGLVLG